MVSIFRLAYSIGRDVVVFSFRRKEEIEELEQRMSRLINLLVSIKADKERIDRVLSHTPSMEQSGAFKPTESEIEVISKKCRKFIKKYSKMTNNQLSPTTELDASTASFMIAELGDFKSNIMTLNAWNLAKLSSDIAKLNTRASECSDRLKEEKLLQKRFKQNLHMLDIGGHVLPVFDTYVDKVYKFLFEDGLKEVGIVGCQGAGKTTVLKKLYNRLLQEKWFGFIIRIDYEMETINVEMLQKDIMAQLNIEPEGAAGTVKNANTISTFLCERKYMLLIDNVSAVVDLEKLGFNVGHEHKKVVVCSRDIKVARQMTAHEIKIEKLKMDEALMLFQNFCGKLSREEGKSAIAERIVDSCGGNPWIIQRAAIYLKDKKDEKSWNYVKTILQSKTLSLGLLDLTGFDKIYQMRYQALETDAKKCLLYGVLFPHKHKIYTDYLVECWVAEGFIDEEDNQKLRRNRDNGQMILDKLTEEDLLQWYPGEKCVIMPTNIRRVALELANPDKKKCAVWFPSEDRTPKDLTWTEAERMSLIGCELELPQCPKPCNLYTLLLDSLRPSREIPDSFFEHMGAKLQVLALNLTEIGALPGSIEVLENLKSLYLNGCVNLQALPSEAANLVKLEFLDISGTSIPTLPPQIGCMIKMRCLRASLSSTNVKEIIPSGIISKLTYLEELSLDTAFDFGVDAAERLANELASLKHLNTLCFNFPDVSSLNTFVNHSQALKNKKTSWGTRTFGSFKISIGCHKTQHPYKSDIESAHEWWLRFSTSEEFSPACQELLSQASAFEVIGHNGLKSFTYSQFNLDPVKTWVVESCKDLENIMDGYAISEGQGLSKVSLLKNLEKLHLYDLESLQCIWNGPVPPTTLDNLTTITIYGCPNLTKILDTKLALSLQSLEYLKVENCSQLSKIVEESGQTSEIVEDLQIKSLKKMVLSNLPELKIISESSSIIWASLKSINVSKCSKLTNLSLSLTNATELAVIQCEESWWRTVSFPDELRQHLLPLCCFKDESGEQYGRGGGGGASSSGTSESTTHPHNTSINPTDDEPGVEPPSESENLQSLKTTEAGLHINSNHKTFDLEMTDQRIS